jgi:hypothetical protein
MIKQTWTYRSKEESSYKTIKQSNKQTNKQTKNKNKKTVSQAQCVLCISRKKIKKSTYLIFEVMIEGEMGRQKQTAKQTDRLVFLIISTD